jgi:hypothetical protein
LGGTDGGPNGPLEFGHYKSPNKPTADHEHVHDHVNVHVDVHVSVDVVVIRRLFMVGEQVRYCFASNQARYYAVTSK